MRRAETPMNADERINSLIRLGMCVPDRESARHFLRHIGAGVLREYWSSFQGRGGGRFCEGADFGRVVDLYVFDRKLRLLVMDAAGRVEISVRAQMPFRSEVKTSMGKLSRRYSGIKSHSLRQQIANAYGTDEKILAPFLHHLTEVRNICAHHERLWNVRFDIEPVLPVKKPALKPFFNFAAQGKLYNTLVLLAHLTDIIPPGRDWARQLLGLLESRGEVCEAAMGFPGGWRAAEFWRR